PRQGRPLVRQRRSQAIEGLSADLDLLRNGAAVRVRRWTRAGLDVRLVDDHRCSVDPLDVRRRRVLDGVVDQHADDRLAPGDTAVTSPDPLTVATSGFDEDHVVARPVITRPWASCAVAVNWSVLPTRRSVFPAGLTVTVCTAMLLGATLTVVCPGVPSQSA